MKWSLVFSQTSFREKKNDKKIFFSAILVEKNADLVVYDDSEKGVSSESYYPITIFLVFILFYFMIESSSLLRRASG